MLDLGDLLVEFFLNTTSSDVSLVPTHVNRDEAWFWVRDWQQRERAANKDLKHKAFVEFVTIDELIHHLMVEGVQNCQLCKDDPNPARALAQALREATGRSHPA